MNTALYIIKRELAQAIQAVHRENQKKEEAERKLATFIPRVDDLERAYSTLAQKEDS